MINKSKPRISNLLLPSFYYLINPKQTGDLLDVCYGEAKEYASGQIARSSATGGAIVSDGATIRKHPLLNYLFLSPEAGCLFLGSEDVTEDLAAGAAKTAQFIFEGVAKIIEEVGPENVVLFISDGAGNNRAAWEKISGEYRWISCIWCVAHVCNLFLKDVGNLEPVQELVEKVNKINTHVNSHEKVRAMVQEMSIKLYGQPLGVIIPAETRFGLYFISMHRLLLLRKVLEAVARDPNYIKLNFGEAGLGWLNGEEDDDGDDEGTGKGEAQAFFDGCHEIVGLLWKLLIMLRVCDGVSPSSGKIYEMVQAVKQDLYRANKLHTAPFYIQDIMFLFEERAKDMLSDFVLAARVVNPEYGNTGTEGEGGGALMSAFLRVAEKLLWNHEDSEGMLDRIMDQLTQYKLKQGPLWANEVVKRQRTRQLPHVWWEMFGGDCPELQEIAIKLLSQVVSSSSAERNWWDHKHTKDELSARISHDTLEKLCYVKAIKRAKDSKAVESYREQIQEWQKVNDRLNIGDENYGLKDGMQSRRRIFHCIIEDWERKAEKKKNASFAMKKLQDKYAGLFVIDKDEDPHLEGEIVGIIWQDDVKEGRSTIAGGWRAKVVELDPTSLCSGFPKALEHGNEILYCLNETLIAMVLDSKWNSKFIAIVGRQIEEVESDDDEGAVAIAGGQEESKEGEEEAKEEWSIDSDEEEEELERPPSRKRGRRGGQ